MNICLIGPANSAHIIKWCKWFTSRGHDVHVVSFTQADIPNVCVHHINLGVDAKGTDVEKIKYLIAGKSIKEIVDTINPDIISVHYATSYGTAVALSGLKDYVLSVWGSDVFDFPTKSIFHKLLLKFSLYKAPHLFSTSKAMALEATKYTKKPFSITPFGVDLELFSPKKRTRTHNDNTFVVGTVKGLSDVYGIRNILEAVAYINDNTPIPIRLRIAGKGPKEEEYHTIANNLGLSNITTWLGFISQEEAAEEWANMDIALIPSISESFGVSAIEAQASGVPLIISNIPGLMETTKPNESSYVIQSDNSEELWKAIIHLYNNPYLCKRMAYTGRQYVEEQYELNQCFERIENLLFRYSNR